MTTYTCPHHPYIEQDHPGKCPECGGMDLIAKDRITSDGEGWIQQYRPLFIIVGMILLVSLLTSVGGGAFDVSVFLPHFMAGFFLVFSGLKLLDVRGFAEGYGKYDLLAKQWYGYGYLYPFLELMLGVAYLIMPSRPTLHIVTMVLMVFSGVGVGIKVARREKFQCACLGTFIKVPLTTVTLVEDFGMALMALLMLVL